MFESIMNMIIHWLKSQKAIKIWGEMQASLYKNIKIPNIRKIWGQMSSSWIVVLPKVKEEKLRHHLQIFLYNAEKH